MKTTLSLLFLATVVWTPSAAIFDSTLDENWQSFKNVSQKHYSTQEEGARRLIWEKNVGEIIRHNLDYDLGIHTFRKGLNEYADMKHDEFLRTMNGYRHSLKVSNTSSTFIPPTNLVLPSSVDWRKQGLVTEVKNQEHRAGKDFKGLFITGRSIARLIS